MIKLGALFKRVMEERYWQGKAKNLEKNKSQGQFVHNKSHKDFLIFLVYSQYILVSIQSIFNNPV
jgi:hypothetical protein